MSKVIDEMLERGWQSALLGKRQEDEPAASESDQVPVTFRASTFVNERGGEVRAYRAGQHCMVDAGFARALYAVGTVDCSQQTIERRGFRRVGDRRICEGQQIVAALP